MWHKSLYIQSHAEIAFHKKKLVGPWPELEYGFTTSLAHEEILEVSGSGARDFLQGQTTCNMSILELQKVVLGACCLPNGRMIANFRVIFFREDLYYLVLPPSMAEVLRTAIAKYALFYKVHCVVRHEGFPRIGIWHTGPLEQTNLEKISSHYTCLTLDKNRSELWTNEDNLDQLLESLTKHYPLVSSDAWILRDITAGIPWISPSLTEKLLPQDCNWDILDGVSFKKGCYTGQEIIARLHFRGTPKTRTQCFTLQYEQSIQAGERILDEDDKPVGTIINTIFCPQDQKTYILSAMRINALRGSVRLNGKILNRHPLPYGIPDISDGI